MQGVAAAPATSGASATAQNRLDELAAAVLTANDAVDRAELRITTLEDAFSHIADDLANGVEINAAMLMAALEVGGVVVER